MSFFYHTTISLAILAAFPFIVLRMVFDPSFRTDIVGRVCGAKDIGSFPGCLWIHAASVGEVRIAKILITALQEKGETRPIIVSTFTPTGFTQAQKEGLGPVFRMPPDSPLWLNKVFDRLHPSLLVLIEAEMWPGLLDGCRRRRIPVLLANGRITQESVNWYEKFRLHQGLRGKSPVSREEERKNNTEGKIISIPILGGLHHRYERLAA